MRNVWFSLILFTTCFSIIHAVPCPSDTTINIGDVISWPPNNTQLALNQNCTFTISYDNSTFLYLELNATDFLSEDLLSISDSYGNQFEQDGINYPDGWRMKNRFAPPATTFRFITGSKSQMKISARLSTKQFSITNVDKETKLNATVPNRLDFFERNNSYVIESSSKVALSCFSDAYKWSVPAAPTKSDWMADYMGAFVYDGSGPTATLIGSVYSAAKKTFYSKSKTMTIYAASGLVVKYLLINDYSNLQNLSNYNLAWAEREQPALITMDARDGSAALTVAGDPSLDDDGAFLANITVTDPTATLSVMAGGPNYSPDYQIVSYNCDNISSYLPQLFPQQLTTFVLSSGTASLAIGNQALDSWELDRLNRHGYLMSRNYRFPDFNGLPLLNLASDTELYHEFKVVQFDEKYDGKDNLTLRNFNEIISISLAVLHKNGSVGMTASSMQIFIQPYNTSNFLSKGSMVSFSSTEPRSGSTAPSIYAGMMFGIWYLLIKHH